MIVVADTSPINYVVLVDAIDVLPDLYQTVVIPKAVFEELQSEDAPQKVRIWIADLPKWISVEKAAISFDSDLTELDQGEREAIALAEELNAATLVIDDRAGREKAQKRGIFVVGTLGVLKALEFKNAWNLLTGEA